MSTYTPEYVRNLSPCLLGQALRAYSQIPITYNLCPMHIPVPAMTTGALSTEVYAPYMHTIPLPSSRPTGAQPTSDGANTLYPIGVVSGLPPAKEIKLGTLTLACLIHIPTPQVHIGTIHSLNPGEDVNALDLFHSLQVLMQRSLDVHVTYPQLPEQMKAEIKAAFIRRNGQPLSSAMIWEAFILGQPTRGGPTWQDLLLGNANIWGVEEQSVRGYSVIHLA